MGEAFLQGVKDRFRHKTEASFEQELASPDLLSAVQDKVARHYRFRCAERKLRLGSIVLFVAEPNRDLVSVFQGNQRIGELDVGGSADLRHFLSEHPVLSSRIPARVCGGPDLLSFYDAILHLPKD